jgi:hypothetical protein
MKMNLRTLSTAVHHVDRARPEADRRTSGNAHCYNISQHSLDLKVRLFHLIEAGQSNYG